jgi:hypothetical protein
MNLPVDPEFLIRAKALLKLWHSWYPWAKVVPIEAETATEATHSERGSATFFSGGVDSWFTALRRPHAVNWITCLGFDMPVSHTDSFFKHRERLSEIAREAGRKLICGATNLRQTRWRQAPWEMLSFGPALGMTALFLEPYFDRVYIPSSFDYATLRPWGSHPLSDELFASSVMETIHDGAEFSRFDKTQYLSSSDVALRTLHVCYRGQDGSGQDDTNCCRCQKCLRTMIALRLLGKLECASLFRPEYLTPTVVSSLYVSDTERPFIIELRDMAIANGDTDLAGWLQCSLDRSRRVSKWVTVAEWLQTRRGLWRAAAPVRRHALADMIVR